MTSDRVVIEMQAGIGFLIECGSRLLLCSHELRMTPVVEPSSRRTAVGGLDCGPVGISQSAMAETSVDHVLCALGAITSLPRIAERLTRARYKLSKMPVVVHILHGSAPVSNKERRCLWSLNVLQLAKSERARDSPAAFG